MIITFTKVVGSGNDFIVLDNRGNKLKDVMDFSKFAVSACRRKLSIGADGLLVLEDSEKGDFKMRIFNPDGSEVAMCGNGARCSAYYAYINGWVGTEIKMETTAGILEAQIKDDKIRLKMTDPKNIRLDVDLGLGRTIFRAHSIDTGVPHVVHFLENESELEAYPVKETGSKIRYHKLFEPEGTNTNFVNVSGDNRIILRTYERGVEDETLACGTGAVASAIISHLIKKTDQPTDVITKSGEILKVYFSVANKKIRDVYLEGSAEIVYTGTLCHPELVSGSKRDAEINSA